MHNKYRREDWIGIVALSALSVSLAIGAENAAKLTAEAGLPDRGVVCLINAEPELVRSLADSSNLTLSLLEADQARLKSTREALYAAGVLNGRVSVEKCEFIRLPYADGLCDAILAPALTDDALGRLVQTEVLRILRPKGVAIFGSASRNAGKLKEWAGALQGVKSELKEDAGGVYLRVEAPELPGAPGTHDWSHWRGSSGNSMCSGDTTAPPFLLQWTAGPALAHGPQATVAAGGRLFFVTGESVKKTPDSEPRTIYAYNGYNGVLLWKHKLADGDPVFWPGYVATADTFYLAGKKGCLLLDAATGVERRKLVAEGESGQWNWIALDGGILCGLLGPDKSPVEIKKGWNAGSAVWSNGGTPREGFGDTFVAYDLSKPGNVPLWVYKPGGAVDSRITALSGGRIFYQVHGKHVGCVTAATGKELWVNKDPAVMQVVGLEDASITAPDAFAVANEQAYLTYWNRKQQVCFAAQDGHVLWQKAKVPFRHTFALKDYFMIGHARVNALTGAEEVKAFGIPGPTACALETANQRTVFMSRGFCCYDMETKRSWQLASIRSACAVGMMPANGLVYGVTSYCLCGYTLNGMVGLASAGKFAFGQKADATRLMVAGDGDQVVVRPLEVTKEDWSAYRHDSGRSGFSPVQVSEKPPEMQWTFKLGKGELPGPSSAAADLVFICGNGGAVRALDAATGKEIWVFHAGAAVRFPPAIMNGRAFVGSCDGNVYALEARTGRLLWTFRAAPQERKICVRESLWSTWPVAGGVVAEDGVVYAGAGIIDTSGNHLYCLDAKTGQIKWQNNSSRMDGNTKNWDLSMLSPLALGHGKLYAGTPGRRLQVFDPATGAQGKDVPTVLAGGAGPELGGHGVGGAMNYAVMDTESIPESLRNKKAVLMQPVVGGDFLLVTASTWKAPASVQCFNMEGATTAVWKVDLKLTSCDALIAAGDLMIAAVSSRKAGGNVPATSLEPAAKAELVGCRLTDGVESWRVPLSAPVIPHGAIVNRTGGIVVALEDGTVVCLHGSK